MLPVATVTFDFDVADALAVPKLEKAETINKSDTQLVANLDFIVNPRSVRHSWGHYHARP